MSVKIGKEFAAYWPAMGEDQLKILEQSILDEGLRENLVVWKETNVLLDGHQRLKILEKHKIPYADRITQMSFPDRLSAKRWAHLAQQGRRGLVDLFTRILHVLEFEPLYRAEAQARQIDGNRKGGKTKRLSLPRRQGRLRAPTIADRMAEEAPCKRWAIETVLLVKKNDPKRFEEMKAKAAKNDPDDPVDLFIEQTLNEAQAAGIKAKVEVDVDNLRKLKSGRQIRYVAKQVIKFKAPVAAQRETVKRINKEEPTANEHYIENTVIDQLPKRKPRDPSRFEQYKITLEEIAQDMDKAIGKIHRLAEMREKDEDDEDYLKALAASPHVRAAFSRFVLASKEFRRNRNEKKNHQKSLPEASHRELSASD